MAKYRDYSPLQTRLPPSRSTEYSEGYRTPMMAAVQAGSVDMVDRLLKYGCRLELRDREKNTALILPAWAWSAKKSGTQIVQRLLDADAHVDLQDDDGNTALYIAARRGNPEAVKILLEAGADPGIKNGQHLTVYEHATKRGSQEVYLFLESFGIKD